MLRKTEYAEMEKIYKGEEPENSSIMVMKEEQKKEGGG